MLNYSNPSACTNSINFNPANFRLIECSNLFFVNICIRSAIRLGQIDLNILLKTLGDSLKNNILIQNIMSISRAGDGFYDFITLLRD